MANKTISMLHLRRILQLKQNGLSNRKIAAIIGVDRKTVNEYCLRIDAANQDFTSLLSLDDAGLSEVLHPINQHMVADPKRAFFEQHRASFIEKLSLKKATRINIWEQYRSENPDGYSYSQFCELLNQQLMRNNAVLTHFHNPGEEAYFDFAGDPLEYVDINSGEVIKCAVFIAVLPYSNYIFVDVLPSQKREQTLRAMNGMLRYFGGVPKACKSDNMAQYVTKANRYEPVFEQLIEQWSLHYNTTLLATRVAKPRDKAAVESAVNTVYNRIYSLLNGYQSRSLEELRARVSQALERLNARPMQKHGRSRKEVFLSEEIPLLGKLPEVDFVQKCRTTVKVQRNYHITITSDKQSYSVPYQYIGKTVTVIYDTDHVEIYLEHQRIAVHKRSYRRASYSTVPSHMPPAHSHVRGWNEDFFIRSATEIGDHTAAAIRLILSQKVFIQQSYNSCLGLLRLERKFGKPRLEAACQRALTGPKVTYTIVHNILQRNLDQAPEDDLFTALPQHDNVRGSQFYTTQNQSI